MWFFNEAGSTNTTAAQLLASDRLDPPALVVTGHQRAGRGQRGKGWFSSPASLAASFVVPAEGRPAPQLPLLVGLVVRDVLAELVGGAPARSLQVKWPNDVLVDGRKVAGILCERKDGADIIGIGINIRHESGEVPAEIAESIIALSDVGLAVDRWEVLAALAEAMRARLLDAPAEQSWQWLLNQWPAHDALLGRPVEVSAAQSVIAGIAGGIDEHGRLRVVTRPGDEVSIASGTVRPQLLTPTPKPTR